jgi:hypothetical protein
MNTYLWLIAPTGVLALIILYRYVKIMMRSRVPFWAASVTKRNAWPSKGSVYFAHCWELPEMGKVGTTQRTTITKRMKEIQLKMTGYPVKLYFAIDYMPFAWAMEQETHRLLRKKRIVFPKGSPMGREWFTCRNEAEVQEIVDAITQAAFAVRFYAISNNCWPSWAKPLLIDMRGGKIVKRPIFTEKNSPGLKIAS